MKPVTNEDRKSDVPATETLGHEFDKFMATDFAELLMDDNVVREGDGSEWIKFVLSNRMRRAFEAGYMIAESKFQPVTKLFVRT